jgi:hypothetical protein
MKKVISIFGVILYNSSILTSCGPNEESNQNNTVNEGPKKFNITVCECDNLFWDYQEKKSKAKTKEERNDLSIEELTKNQECYELEKSLGTKLKEEQNKCK